MESLCSDGRTPQHTSSVVTNEGTAFNAGFVELDSTPPRDLPIPRSHMARTSSSRSADSFKIAFHGKAGTVKGPRQGCEGDDDITMDSQLELELVEIKESGLPSEW
jgi:hypothetical protein